MAELLGNARETWTSSTTCPHRCAACGADGGPVRCLDPAPPLTGGTGLHGRLGGGGGHAAASKKSRVRLASTPAEVAAYAAVRAHDAVAWHDGQRIGRTCRSHRSDGPEVAGQPCHCGVTGGVSVADLEQAVQHGAAEACRQAPVQRHVKNRVAGRRSTHSPLGRRRPVGRYVEDAGADAIGQGLQDRVMVLAGVRDTDQPSLGRREQQRADGTVDGAVSDVENALGLCGGG